MLRLRSISKLDYEGMDDRTLIKHLVNRMQYALGLEPKYADQRSWYNTLSLVVRDRLIDRWVDSIKTYRKKGKKRVYYLSMEFLTGRLLQNALMNLQLLPETHKALHKLGVKLENLYDIEPDAALGNGGLGRLAACFLDSMAAIGIPGFGYGIRYEYGMFNQRIVDGQQIEHPENWLRYGNPWEIPRTDVLFPIQFGGSVDTYEDKDGRVHHTWNSTQTVMAMAYDLLVPGDRNNRANRLRLWSAKSSRDFDLRYFNEGNYIRAVEEKNASENLSRVLYPDDTTEMGRTLRLKQEYFFVSAALQDIIRQFKKQYTKWTDFPQKVAVQLNDTHPAIAIPELMRLLMDEHKLEWDEAWSICVDTFSYTNHTLMPEALETWPVSLIEKVLPRHMQIIFEINQRFLESVRQKHPDDWNILGRVSLIDEYGDRRVRMAHLAAVGSHKINGVSWIHTDLLKKTVLHDIAAHYPDRFVNLTNGVNPRRWVKLINRDLHELIQSTIGGDWIAEPTQLKRLANHANDAKFQEKFRQVKLQNKVRLAEKIKHHLDIEVNPNTLFDVHIKRIHEYKRQLLNVLHVITLYNRLCDSPHENIVPRTVIFSGKAAPGYQLAKLIIRLINDVSIIINNNPATADKLKVVFIPNYDVSTAGDIVPAAELSQQISMAGTEASGTGNMKLAFNGALTIGTLDGANIEMRDHVGHDNMFVFGLLADQARQLSTGLYKPREYLRDNPTLERVIDMIEEGYFSPGEKDRYHGIVDALTRTDPYLVMADYESYIACQAKVETTYIDTAEWTRQAILNVAGMHHFSSDRTIREYAAEVWKIKI